MKNFLFKYLIKPFFVFGLITNISAEKLSNNQSSSCLNSIKQFNEKHGFNTYFDEATDFDIRWDRNLSCYLGINSKTVEDSIIAVRHAILYPDELTISKGVIFPIKINDFTKEKEFQKSYYINNWKEFLNFRYEVLDENHIALISCASIKSIKILPDDGAMLGNGFMWFRNQDKGFGLSTINVQNISAENVLQICRSNY